MQRQRRFLTMERLEGRELLAGDITLVRHFDLWTGGIIPSTDAAGITYHPPSGSLVISDSEINGLGPTYFNGNNIFKTNLLGNQLQGGIKSGNSEPTGITYNEFTGFWYVTNDDGARTITRYDDRLNTPLQVVSTLSAHASAGDPEGITSDPVTGRMYVVSGESGGEVQTLVYDANLNFLYRFTLEPRLLDAEGIAFHKPTGHLFIVDGGRRKIFEYTVIGALVEEYDIGGFTPRPVAAQGLTFGPTSNPNDSPSNLSLYIADGMKDNFPDGRVYEAVIGGSGGGNSLDIRVSSSADDAEERADGKTVLTSSDLEMAFDAGGNQVVGLRFQNLGIPQGATITSAYVQFKVDETTSEATSLTIRGQAVNNAPSFTTANGNITSRASTSASVAWSPAAWTPIGSTGSAQRTPDLKAIVQEIVNRSGWSSGNSLALTIRGTGERVAEAFDGDPAGAPLLHIQFTTDGTPANQPPTISPISNRSVQQGATLQLTATADDPDGPNSALRFSLDPGAPSGAAINAVSGVLTWTPSLAQAPGNYNVTVRVTDMGSPPQSATAIFLIVVTSVGGGGSDSIDVRIASSSDDAEEKASGGVNLTSTDLELVFDSSNQTIGLRFAAISIPRGALITNAYVQFTVDTTSSEATSLSIRGQTADNASAFAAVKNNVSSRSTTSASVAWSPPAWNSKGVAGVDQRTPNLASVLQPIVNRSGWLSGNALALLLTGSGKRVARSYDGNAPTAALLHVEYIVASGAAASSSQAGLQGNFGAPANQIMSSAASAGPVPFPILTTSGPPLLRIIEAEEGRTLKTERLIPPADLRLVTPAITMAIKAERSAVSPRFDENRSGTDIAAADRVGLKDEVFKRFGTVMEGHFEK